MLDNRLITEVGFIEAKVPDSFYEDLKAYSNPMINAIVKGYVAEITGFTFNELIEPFIIVAKKYPSSTLKFVVTDETNIEKLVKIKDGKIEVIF
jgi:hypothetical protein